MSKPHGTVILCERENGATVAWEDERLSKEVPAGYFVEWWPKRLAAHAGTMEKGYEPRHHFLDGTSEGQYRWLDPYDAVVWCRDHQWMRAEAKGKKDAA